MKHYQADLSAGSLMLPESRVIARLLVRGVDAAGWEQAIRADNLLQKSSPATAIRQARLIRFRLESLDSSLWPLIAEGDKEIAIQALFAAALKHSALLYDFLREVVADHARRLETKISPMAWERFLEDCCARDPGVALWSTSTRNKLLQVIIRILAEARYLETTRSLRLLPPHLNPVVISALKAISENRLLQTMELDV